MLCHWLRFNATFFSQNPGSHETITDIITKGLFIDMRHYVQGLELFEEVKVKSCNTLQTFTNQLFSAESDSVLEQQPASSQFL